MSIFSPQQKIVLLAMAFGWVIAMAIGWIWPDLTFSVRLLIAFGAALAFGLTGAIRHAE